MTGQLSLVCTRCSAPYQCDPPFCCAWCRAGDGTCPCRYGRQWTWEGDESRSITQARAGIA